MDERSFFDRIAPSWDQNEVLSTEEKVNHILDIVDLKEGDSVLDLGTGTGVLLPHIAKKIGLNGRITAVDYSSGMLEQAIKKFSYLNPLPEFLNMDFETETISGEYDKIILYCVYPHLHTPVDTLKWLRKVNLKEKGEIIIAFPCSPEFINNIHREKHSESDKLLPASELASNLRKNGLEAYVLEETENAYVISIK